MPKQLLEMWLSRWHLPIAGVILCVVIFFVAATALQPFELKPTTMAFVSASVAALSAVIWLCFRRTPKISKNRIGIVIAITCESASDHHQVASDFVFPFRRLLSQGAKGNRFEVLHLAQRHLEGVHDLADVIVLQKRCGAHFAISGRLRWRQVGGVSTAIIELVGFVGTPDISRNSREQISKEFAELWPHRVQVPKSDEAFGFEFTSEWSEVVVRYVLGLTAACSGLLEDAQLHFENTAKLLVNRNARIPVYRKLQQRLPARLCEVWQVRGARAYHKWLETNGPEELQVLQMCSEALRHMGMPTYQAKNLVAISEIFVNANFPEALRIVSELKNAADPVWHLNLAFLSGMSGDLRVASRHYRNASIFDVQPDAYFEVEHSIDRVIQLHGDSPEAQYCLAEFNFFCKNDKVSADRHFNKFLSLCPLGGYGKEREIAIGRLASNVSVGVIA